MQELRLITEPAVYLVGYQNIEPEAVACFGADQIGQEWQSDLDTGAEALVEMAGRLCYMSYTRPRPGGGSAYLQHLLESGHGSVLEHAVFSLVIAGVSRTLTHELVRHRHMSFSQLSQRYVDHSETGFVVPPAIVNDPELLAVWRESVEQAQQAYHKLAGLLTAKLASDPSYESATDRRKAARQAARSVLPGCTETKVFVTANARSWRHFFETRGSAHADAEMRRLAVAIHGVLSDAAPGLFEDIRKVRILDGSFGLQVGYTRV